MSRRRKISHGEHEEGNSERWTTSYMDMVTVLMCLFIVLYAMSTVDQTKFEKLRLALSTGFGQTKSQKIDTATGVVVPATMAGRKGVSTTNAQAATTQITKLDDIKAQLQQALQAQGIASNVSMNVTSEGLTISLVGASSFFSGNSANLQPLARQTLDVIGPVLTTLPNQIDVQGNADSSPSGAPYPTNWDLAGARSTEVLKYLVSSSGMPVERIFSTSFGSARPLSPNMTRDQWPMNRRVDIVVMSTGTDSQKAVMAEILAARK